MKRFLQAKGSFFKMVANLISRLEFVILFKT